MDDDFLSPVPVAALDDQYRRNDRDYRRLWLLSAVAVGLVVIGVVAFLVVTLIGQQSQINTQQRQLTASCGVWQTVGSLTPTVPAVTPAGSPAIPSREGVVLIVESRRAFFGQRCGTLPAPTAGLLHWAAYYHLSL
jgi:hypothetical protein